jgi:hypothetical protein
VSGSAAAPDAEPTPSSEFGESDRRGHERRADAVDPALAALWDSRS